MTKERRKPAIADKQDQTSPITEARVSDTDSGGPRRLEAVNNIEGLKRQAAVDPKPVDIQGSDGALQIPQLSHNSFPFGVTTYVDMASCQIAATNSE